MIPGRRTADGALYVTTAAPSVADNFVNGVCLTNDGVLKVNANAPQKFSQGHGFMINGAFCIDVLGSPVANYINGLPVTATGALKCQLNQPVSPGDHYIGGLRVGPLGGVYIVDTTPIVGHGFSNGFSDGFDAMPSSGGGFSPADLFLSGEQGVWYDPSDLSTMFQDSAGTTPVTAAGQPVGLILDKSKGLALGSELVTNGDFSGGTTGWSANGATLTVESGALKAVSTSSSQGPSQSVITESGKRYVVSITINSATVAYHIGYGDAFAQGQIYDSGALSGARTYNFSFVGNGTSAVFWVYFTDSGTIYIDNISVKELSGNHATQATASKRPQYQTDGTYHWLQFDGVDDAMATGSIDFTSTDKVSVFSGLKRNNNTVGFIYEFSSTLNSNNGAFNLLSGTDGATTDGYTFKTRGDVNTTIGARVNDVGSPVKSVISTSGDILADLTTIRANTIAGINGTQDQGTGNFGNYPLYIGSRDGTSLPLNGNIYQLVTLDRLATAQEITDTETYINGKTGAY